MVSAQSWKIARIWGIGIYIDPSWLLILAFLVWSLATGYFSLELRVPRGGLNAETLGLALLASLILFASVLAHELAHSYMALKYGIPVLSITLFFFGGVAQIGEEPDRPRTEFLIAIMGPLLSFVLAILFAILWIWPTLLLTFIPSARSVLLPLSLVAQYLAQANLGLALFNLLPGFPLDGGRILRALLWGLTHNVQRATRWAFLVGRGIALLLILGAVFSLTRPALLGFAGLWLALIGLFVWRAAGEAYRQVELRVKLQAVTVGEIMNRSIERAPAGISLQEFIDRFVLTRRGETFAAEKNSRVVGLIDLAALERIPRLRWAVVTVGEAMRPLDSTPRTLADEPAFSALQRLGRFQGVELPVLNDHGELEGLVGQAEIGRYLRLKQP